VGKTAWPANIPIRKPMKQYKITTENLTQDSADDCYLAPNDPVHELKSIQYLAGLGSDQRTQDQRALENKKLNTGSNISLTGSEKRRIEREQGIEPGTPEWFRLWFSRPYLTNERPIGKTDES